MRAPVVLATLLTLALAGCTQSTTSTSGFEGEEKAVAQKVADLAEDGQRDRPADICGDIVAKALADKIRAAGSSCEAEMKKAIDDADGFDLEVKDVTIDGDAATAEVAGTSRGKEVTRTFAFAKQDGGWRITSFAAGG